uniref:Uncharacterized protein n=1 Tax=Taenioma perpusillum TaxID=210852 RepID=A0A1Z1MQW7_9FLOR|nr:hypothetical protein [Taenioma perpusillum]ARW68470.1 hypothetical protein [Taenioma perpusillum]
MTIFYTISKNYFKYIDKLDCQLFTLSNHNKVKASIYYNNKNQPILISKLNNSVLNKTIDYRFISRNFWSQLINQYWQEIVFISTTNQLSDDYTNQLKLKGFLTYQGSAQKKFLSDFNRDLIQGKIEVDSTNNSKKSETFSYNQKSPTYLKYVWRKGLNWYIYSLYKYFLWLKNGFSSVQPIASINASKKVDINNLPVFILVNQKNHIIMSESPDKIFLNNNIFNPLYGWYNNHVIKNISQKKAYLGLLFMNFRDASEYKDYIINKSVTFYNYKYNFVKLYTSQINIYYKLIYSYIYNTEFRLIPDLKEVSSLIKKYQYYRHVTLDKNQQIGHNYFQGQPIYIIQPIQVKDTKSSNLKVINYFYSISRDKKLIQYKAIFLNYQTAVNAWHKFKYDYPHYNLPNKPNLLVSNLEKFMRSENNSSDYIFIPSLETYQFIKYYKHSKKNVYDSLNNYMMNIRNQSKEIFYSLLSKYPTN